MSYNSNHSRFLISLLYIIFDSDPGHPGPVRVVYPQEDCCVPQAHTSSWKFIDVHQVICRKIRTQVHLSLSGLIMHPHAFVRRRLQENVPSFNRCEIRKVILSRHDSSSGECLLRKQVQCLADFGAPNLVGFVGNPYGQRDRDLRTLLLKRNSRRVPVSLALTLFINASLAIDL